MINPKSEPLKNNSSEENLYTYEEAAKMTAISVTLVERFVTLNLLEPQQSKLSAADIAHIAQMLRLRRDLGLNWIGASMVLNLSREITQLKARLRAYEAHQKE